MSRTTRRLMRGLALVAAVLLIAALWIGSSWRAILNPDTYKGGLTEAELTALDQAMFDLLVSRASAPADSSAPTLADVTAALVPADRQAAIAQIIPLDGLRKQANQTIDAIFRWLGDKPDALAAAYDLSALEQGLTGKAGDGLITTILGKLPPCTAAQALDLRAERRGTSSDKPPLCLPTVLQRPTVRALLTTAVSNFAASLDQPLTVHDALTGLLRATGDNSPETTLVRLRQSESVGQRLVNAAYLLPLALLALLVAVGVRSLAAFGRWIGGVAVAAALVGFILGWIVPALTTAQFGQLADMTQPGRLIVGVLASDTSALFSHYTRALIAQAVVLGLLGLMLLIVAALMNRRARRANPIVEPASV